MRVRVGSQGGGSRRGEKATRMRVLRATTVVNGGGRVLVRRSGHRCREAAYLNLKIGLTPWMTPWRSDTLEK